MELLIVSKLMNGVGTILLFTAVMTAGFFILTKLFNRVFEYIINQRDKRRKLKNQNYLTAKEREELRKEVLETLRTPIPSMTEEDYLKEKEKSEQFLKKEKK